MNQTAKSLTSIANKGGSMHTSSGVGLSKGMKWTMIISLIVMTVACVVNAVYNIGFASPKREFDTYSMYTSVDSVAVDSIEYDDEKWDSTVVDTNWYGN